MGLLSALGAIGGNLLFPGAGGAIGGLLGGAIEGNQASSAAQQATAQTQAATNEATKLQREMWQAQQAQQQPWLQAGQTALNALTPLATNYTPFGMAQFQQDPGYAFRLSEGQKTLDRQAAARGGLISGGALKAASRYGQEMGSQEYQNAFNRYQTERTARLAPLQSLAGVGQTTAQQLGAAGQQYGQNVGNALINQGYAGANAGLGAYQANQSMYGNAVNAVTGGNTADWTKAGNALTSWLNTPSQNSGGYTNLEF
jgi:hypothetical protein